MTRRLRALARQSDATLFMALLGAFAALLSRYSDLDDVVVGTPVAGRTQVETEGLIGFFVNTFVLRTDLTGDPTLHRDRHPGPRNRPRRLHPPRPAVREAGRGASPPNASLSHSPLFQVMFLLHNLPAEPLTLPGLTSPPSSTKPTPSSTSRPWPRPPTG